MKSVRSLAFAGLGLVTLCVVVQLVVPRRAPVKDVTPTATRVERDVRASRSPRPVRSPELRMETAPIRQQPSVPEKRVSSAGQPQPEPPKTKSPVDGNVPKVAWAGGKTQKAGQPTPGGSPAQTGLQDPMARAALAFVGADPDAEMYWYQAINDPSLSAHERSDLIEDLNEDGLSDPRNPTPEDLPLILNRIQLIEAIAWDAVDEVNAAAFQEAYKDLVNLAFRVLGNG
jgi:hypothetical protein